MSVEIFNYLNIFSNVTASSVTQDSATFNNINIETSTYLTGMYSGSSDNTFFYLNGLNVGGNSISSIENSGNNLLVLFNTSSLGYILESTDEVTLVGKFKIV